MQTILIDNEFRDKIPSMPVEDFEGLKADILRDGYVRDPLVIWDEENILLDGHHRWRVIQEHPELPYITDRKSFPDRWAAIAWICANQLHKHNMNETQRDKLVQEEHDARLKSVSRNASGKFSPMDQNDPPERTRDLVAKEHGMSPAAVMRAVESGRGIDKAAEVDPDFKRDVLSGAVKAKKSDLAAIRKLNDPDEIAAAIEEIRNPPQKPKPKPVGNTKEMRERMKLADEVIAEMYSPEIKEFTIEMLESDIELNGMEYVSVLRNTLADHGTMLVGDNRKRVGKKIDSIIEEIQKIRRLVE